MLIKALVYIVLMVSTMASMDPQPVDPSPDLPRLYFEAGPSCERMLGLMDGTMELRLGVAGQPSPWAASVRWNGPELETGDCVLLGAASLAEHVVTCCVQGSFPDDCTAGWTPPPGSGLACQRWFYLDGSRAG